jgi:hypothetical protein
MHRTSYSIVLLFVLGVPVAASAQQATPEAQPAPPPPPPEAYVQPAPQAQQPYAPQPYVQPVQQAPYAQQPAYAAQPVAPAGPPREVSRPRIGLVISGGVLLLVSWVIHAAVISPLAGWSLDRGLQPEWDEFRGWGAVPLAGPWVQLAVKPTATSQDGWSTYLAIDGILQTTGLVLLILGFAWPSTEVVYGENESDGSSFALTPLLDGNTAGLAAVGRF